MYSLENSVFPNRGLTKISGKKINKSNTEVGFGRALTNLENNINSTVIQMTLKDNGVKNFGAILHSAVYPPYHLNGIGINTGVGSSTSKGNYELKKFLKEKFGINLIASGPDGGEINLKNICPYSLSPFGMGKHQIDPGKLVEMNLLDFPEIGQYKSKNPNDSINDYEGYFRNIDPMLRKAYEKFKIKVQKDSKLNMKYESFQNNDIIKPWLNDYARFYALAKNKYQGNQNIFDWDLNDRIIYLRNNNTEKVILDNTYADDVEYFKFCQFVANEQQKDNVKVNKTLSLREMRDIPIGWSWADVWRRPNAFDVNLETKEVATLCTPMQYNSYEDWCMPALKYKVYDGNNQRSDINEDSKKLMREKWDYGLGVGLENPKDGEKLRAGRIDAAWVNNRALINVHNNGPTDNSNHLLWSEDANGVYFNIIDEIRKKYKIPSQFMMAENIGGDEDFADCNGRYSNHSYFNSTKGRIEGTNDLVNRFGYKRYGRIEWDLPDKNTAWLSPGNHDEASVMEKFPYVEHQTDEFARLVNGPGRNGSENILLMIVNSLFGRKEGYNSFQKESWELRIPENYEELYFKNIALKDNKTPPSGLNMSEALARSLEWQGKQYTPQYKILKYFAEVLKEGGKQVPYTQKDAEKNKGKFNIKFFQNQEVTKSIHDLRIAINKADSSGKCKTLTV
jgi:hypothetical protein